MRAFLLLLFLPLVSLAGEKEGTLDLLGKWLALDRDKRPSLADQAFADMPLSGEEAEQAEVMLVKDHAAMVRATRAKEMQAKAITIGKETLRFNFTTFGEKPKGGRSLYISMHGGGGAPARVNDQQWRNQLRLYQPAEGIYLAPRAPTDTWNLWHQGHIDPLFDRLITNLVVFEDVNPERVYLMGYSAGGDGVYQLAPRMSDRFAAAAMMAGHPNETSPVGLRNIPFALQVGGRDGAYNRNGVAANWQKKLAELRKGDPGGYEHFVKIYEGKGHWMDLEDKVAVPWMAKYERRRFPEKIVWKQDNVTHERSYWLALLAGHGRGGQMIVASRKGQKFIVEDSGELMCLTILLNDSMADLDQPIEVISGGKPVFKGKVERSIGVISRTLAQRGDPGLVFSAAITVDCGE
ncbi:MAG: alpha/beta hydrolase [Verrucomicrobiaceae bacterium]|nr:alpha/beta hydrolase [Verrucomicrobiaceae bacterium]